MSERKALIQRLPILSYLRKPSNPRLKTDIENARAVRLAPFATASGITLDFGVPDR